jgi:hypothetical protein
MTPPPPKIPATCKACGETLSRSDMEEFLDRCKDEGWDPFDAARGPTPGILCLSCALRVLGEALDNPTHSLHAIAKRSVSRTKRAQIGLRLVPKSKD